MTKRIIGRGFSLSMERADGEFVPIGEPQRPPIIFPECDIEITGTLTLGWVDRWMLQAWLTPPM